MKKCSKCKQFKEEKYFSLEKRSADGVGRRCKECRATEAKQFYRRNAERIKQKKGSYAQKDCIYKLRIRCSKHKMTSDQFHMLYCHQFGCCAICFQRFHLTKLVIDHDHQTDKIRGLLCSACNAALGSFKDNIFYLRSAIYYLLCAKDKQYDKERVFNPYRNK